MEPPVLGGVFSDKVLGGLYILLRDPLQGVVLVGPFSGHDKSGAFDLEEEAIAHPAAAGNTNGHIMLHCNKADAFICTCFATEEINEDALFAGILVGDKAEARTGGGDGFQTITFSVNPTGVVAGDKLMIYVQAVVEEDNGTAIFAVIGNIEVRLDIKG